MARSITTLEDQTLYRSVLMFLFPGVHDMELKTYTDANGDYIHYHRVWVNGPYEQSGQAKAQMNRLLKGHENRLNLPYKLEDGTFSAVGAYGGKYWSPNGTAPEVTAFVEAVTPSWSQVAGTLKTA